ncbi:NAD(P)/FAD-dependent oxidoreductase [Amycolatopsis mongoliensis]|uniref:NAD(P)/FAD-dependent oxidoreductase n=1 Tax=Amycolatopsis mongoliensis TaxID=715475 RepID=A0A9Y2NIU3_9PSEU|nr:NAD(P)/FAD-dependent oxidoreductase [Amycolatopsis sp. 4-36]WIY06782.1 NAD(P)/FAD-dependent oxidoreductase [Amycolatopsis sp. 4-36]
MEQRHFAVLVVGAGASGLGAAIRLGQAGVGDLAVLEKAGALGGTWRDNTYPGCACDVPSALYSYSFAPNPGWTRAFAGQAEIRAYLADTAARFGVTDKIRYGVEVTRAQWNGSRWELETSRGPYTARILVAGTGPWHEPLIPDLPGLAGFPGEVFHSARWNHDYDLTGKRVAVIGTGASAVQFVPRIVPRVGRLHLFQRTAQWVLPKPDHPVPGAERFLLRRFPALQRAVRGAEYGAMEALGFGFRHPWLLRQVQKIGLAHLRLAVRDPALRRALTPDYTLGCKRLLMSNAYYPSLTRSHVDVHPTAVRSLDGRRVVGADGSVSEVDAIIFGTGFHILDMPVSSRVFDRDGRSLDDHWKGSPQAYAGTTVAGFPNLYLLLGPSLGTGHSSAFTILEAQLRHTVAAVTRTLRSGWTSVSVRPQAQAAFNAEVQAALPGTVYQSGGCSSYYTDVNGRNSFSWPFSTGRLRARVGSFDEADYDIGRE